MTREAAAAANSASAKLALVLACYSNIPRNVVHSNINFELEISECTNLCGTFDIGRCTQRFEGCSYKDEVAKSKLIVPQVKTRG